MKNLIVFFAVAALIFSCALPEDIKKEMTATVLADVVLYDGVMNDTTNLLFQKTPYGIYDFPNSIIQVKFEFSDPEVFDGTHTIKTNTTSAAHTINIFTPTFTYIENIDLTTNLYFRVESLNWDLNSKYDGRDVDCKITWLR